MEQSDLQSKYQTLQQENALLDQQIQEFRAKGASTNLQPQIKALHDYNEMKDLTQMVLSYLANAEQVSVVALHERYNLPLD